MKVVCAWCQKVLTEGPSPTSRGICPPCEATLTASEATLVEIMQPPTIVSRN